MNVGNRSIEQAEAMVALERDTAVASIRQGLRTIGTAVCCDCDDDIDAARRRALPSARRCADCQERHERKVKRGW